VHRAREEGVILVVHDHDDEEFRPARRIIVHLAQREAVVLEVVRVTCRSRIAHMRKLVLVFVRAEVEQFRWQGGVENKLSWKSLRGVSVRSAIGGEHAPLVAAGHALWNAAVADGVVAFVRVVICIVPSRHV